MSQGGRCVSLMTEDGEHLSLCFFAICTSWGKLLLKLLDPFWGVFTDFLLLSFESSLYILTQVFRRVYDLQRFSPHLGLVTLFS